jgi:sugar (pentulose or hexulose) kinase
MYLGLDFGTSGCRACVIDSSQHIHAEASVSIPEPQLNNGRIEQDSAVWFNGLKKLFEALSHDIDLQCIKRVAVDGTSGTVLLCDSDGHALTKALMYNDASSTAAVDHLRRVNPDKPNLCMLPSSALAKAISLCATQTVRNIKILNHADFISNHLCNRWGFSDYHNALKLGFDEINQLWPPWVVKSLPENSLPRVFVPGQEIGRIDPQRANEYGLSKTLTVCCGSTDSNASFMATLSTRPGDAVTSLGSTLVLKILDDHPTEDLATGIYSHKMGRYWLTGGGSNAGGNILKRYFTREQLADYSTQLDVNQPSGLNYYPLPETGERFPICDPAKRPVLTPRPDSDIKFLQGILEGLSTIEKSGYEKLSALGVQRPRQILTTGGGAQNVPWTKIRSRMLGIAVKPAMQTEASFGSAILALQGLSDYT